MANNDKIEMSGVVTKVLPGTKFLVNIKVGENDHELLCTISGKLRLNNILILAGDKVDVSISPYDLSRGVITWRNK